ncbi:tyrosinase family protein [Pseudomonas sp. SDO5522_S412]|uniref:tyrosinase family protein n=1 Tax=Pseudomonas sp. K5002 TaxID=2738828 RepID=UPI0015C1259E|nr:tyrosinase family protein [Pseudomonas sp. K5002]NWD86888.1 tyrosinase family protein [Pseudomonas sp. K5002]
MIVAKPTWATDIHGLFSAPYWIPQEQRAAVAASWVGCMNAYFVFLEDPASVKTWSETIYQHLASRSMPLTLDQQQFWPIDALETFRLWVNQGWRLTPASPFDEAERIPPPDLPHPVKRVRQDIRALTQEQLNLYRSRLDDVMQVANADSGSPWQRYAYIHTNWCLHYQEAFALWHRAYLLYLEALIDCPIPYWDWMAEDASVDGSPQAGLPQAFLDETYVHPHTGEVRPNPLRYAAAKDGCSKVCEKASIPGVDCRFVQRNPLFYTKGETQRVERTQLYGMSRIFQQQVVDALKFNTFSQPQGVPGYPWANIPVFDPPQEDDLYPNRALNFDGLYEQPHDNYHGWIGGDMADNAYTAFDPVFSSYHANIDRMLEVWIRAHPAAQYTTQCLLQPFAGSEADDVTFTSADAWRYTTLGDMAQDSRHIGYDYGVPVAPPFGTRRPAAKACCQQSSTPMQAQEQTASLGPWVVFDHVRCTHDTYLIDVFLNQPDATPQQVSADNPHYVGRFSRIGMGLVDDKGRCITHGVSRALNAARTAAALNLRPTDTTQLSVVVTHLDSARVLTPQEYAPLPGFIAQLVWDDPRQTVAGPAPSAGCCSVSTTTTPGEST